MPFYGQDWRSPGEQWVRTTEGWARLHTWRLRLLESLNESLIERLVRLTSCSSDVATHPAESFSQPHVYIFKNTKERKMQTCISESFQRLEIIGAAKDLRRLNYVCKLMELLIRDNLSSVSGTTQKIVFNLLEVILNQVKKTETNHHTMQLLLEEARYALNKGTYNHVGSGALWKKHLEHINKMQNTLNGLDIIERKEDGKLMISDLPDECVKLILDKMADHKDIVNTGMTECRNHQIIEDTAIWRDLCLFHFDNDQIFSVLKKGEKGVEDIGWKKLYSRLVKRYGMRDVFAEMIHMCMHCNALYWQHHGHPCYCPDLPRKSIPVPPVMCLQLLMA